MNPEKAIKMSKIKLDSINNKLIDMIENIENQLSIENHDDNCIQELSSTGNNNELSRLGYRVQFNREYISSFYPSNNLSGFADELDRFIEQELRKLHYRSKDRIKKK